MDAEQLLAIADAVVLSQHGRHLSDLELKILQGSIAEQTYEEIAEQSGYSVSHVKRKIGPKLWRLLSQGLNEEVSKTNFRSALKRRASQIETRTQEQPGSSHKGSSNEQVQQAAIEEPGEGLEVSQQRAMPLCQYPSPQVDWGEAISVADFRGRTTELTLLYRWVVEERCRLIVLLGMGGIGKTALSVKLTQQIVGREDGEMGRWGNEEVPALLPPPSSIHPSTHPPIYPSTYHPFRFVIWRSLRNAPPLETLLAELVPFLSQQQDTQATLSRLICWLRSQRCFIILDNLETLLQPGQVGAFRQGYEDYAELLRLGAEAAHQSCILITSRESPTDVTIFAGQHLPVRSLRLAGSAEAAQAILQAKGLVGTPQQRHLLGNRYANSPLALKMIATSIQSLFDGNIATFLQENTLVFSGIRRLLDQQFDRLSSLEQSVMFWLAINREWTNIDEIHRDILPTVSRSKILEALEYLTERSLIETSAPTLLEKRVNGYTQQPVVMEYVTERLIEQVVNELNSINLNLFNTHALIKATAKDYVRQTQIRLILQPVLNCLDGIKEQLLALLQIIRSQSQLSSGYAAGNLLNLLCYSDLDISSYDFSHLTIRQAYLKSQQLHHINFANAHFTDAVLTYNFGSILAVAFSPDGRLLATGDSNQNINFWQVADGRSLAIYQGHTDWVWSIAFSPDGERLASGSDDRTVRLWDVETQQCLRVLHGHTKQVWAVAFSPTGEILASGSDDQTIRLWDIRTQQCLHVLQGHTNGVWTVAFSPTGEILASGSEDQTIRLWDIRTQQCLHVFQGHTSWVRSVAFSPDGETIASASEDQTIRLWSLNTRQCLHVLRGHTNQVLSVAFSPNGELIASGSDDQTVRLWDTNTHQCLHVFQGHSNRVCAIAFNPNRKMLASGSDDQTVRLWDVRTQQGLHILQGYTNRVCAVAFSPAGEMFASSSDDQTVRLWDTNTHQCLHILPGHSNRVRSVAFSPDGGMLVSGSDDRTLRLWDMNTRQCLHTLQGHTSWVWSVSFSSDGETIASGGDNQTVRLWNVRTRECMHILQGHTSWVWSVAFSPNGKMLASASDDQTVRLWDVRTQECQHVFQGHTSWVRTVAFAPQCDMNSPDGELIASGSADQTVRLWNVRTRQCLHIFRGHTSQIRTIAFSPDGKAIASGSEDQTIRLWDVRTRQCLHTLQEHTSWIRSVAFSPDGEMLVSGSDDETMKLWNIKTGECLATLRAPRPYEGSNITGTTGLTDAQRASMIALGAVEGTLE